MKDFENADALFLESYTYFKNNFIKKAKGLTKKELQFYSSTFVRGQASYLEYAIMRKEVHPDFYVLVINDLFRSHNMFKNRALEVHKKSSPQLLSNYKDLKNVILKIYNFLLPKSIKKK